jgi:hypothetical protein
MLQERLLERMLPSVKTGYTVMDIRRRLSELLYTRHPTRTGQDGRLWIVPPRLMSRWQVICVAMVAIVSIAACAGDMITEADELANPMWMVTEIDGIPVPYDEVYFWFNSSELTSASLSTHIVPAGGGRAPRCRESASEIAMDVDGDRLTFAGFEDVPLNASSRVPCDQELADLHDRIALALRENESWQRTSETLVLRGSSEVRLESSGSD